MDPAAIQLVKNLLIFKTLHDCPHARSIISLQYPGDDKINRKTSESKQVGKKVYLIRVSHIATRYLRIASLSGRLKEDMCSMGISGSQSQYQFFVTFCRISFRSDITQRNPARIKAWKKRQDISTLSKLHDQWHLRWLSLDCGFEKPPLAWPLSLPCGPRKRSRKRARDIAWGSGCTAAVIPSLFESQKYSERQKRGNKICAYTPECSGLDLKALLG